MRAARVSTLILAAAVVGLFSAPAAPAAGQEDFRSLDQGRPIQVVDAYPVKYLEWEVQLGLQGGTTPGGEEIEGSLELEVGLFPNVEAGLEVEPVWREREGRSFGVHGIGAHLLYNVNQEAWSWPAFSLQVEAEAPIGGGPGLEEWTWGGRGVATRSFASRLRVHANAGYRVQGEADGGDHWIGGVALDYPPGLTGRLLVGDLWVEVPTDSGRTRLLAEVGGRFQLSNRTVLDLGLASRLDRWQDGADVRLVVGLGRAFGVRALTPVPPWPDPSIR